MEFEPIVNGLEADYPEINFVRFDANKRENEFLQTQLGLRGHPSIALIAADGTVTQTWFGGQTEDTLRPALDTLIP